MKDRKQHRRPAPFVRSLSPLLTFAGLALGLAGCQQPQPQRPRIVVGEHATTGTATFLMQRTPSDVQSVIQQLVIAGLDSTSQMPVWQSEKEQWLTGVSVLVK